MLVWGKSDQCYVRLRALFKLYGMLFEGKRPAEWDSRLLDKATLIRDQTAYEARLVASLLLFIDMLTFKFIMKRLRTLLLLSTGQRIS